ncbi:ankyrin repeat domain-containing protein [Candidatus Dependentiae bacterium]
MFKLNKKILLLIIALCSLASFNNSKSMGHKKKTCISCILLCFKKICAKKKSYNKYCKKPAKSSVFDVIKKGNLKKIKKFLKEKKVDINKPVTSGLHKNKTPLRYKGEILLPGYEGETPLWVACECENVAIVKELLSHKNIDVNQVLKSGQYKGLTPFYWACYRNELKLVKCFIRNSSKEKCIKFINKVVQSGQHKGKTSLYWACFNGNYQIVKLLLKNGAKKSINKPDKKGKTPLHWACFNDKISIVKLLIKKGGAVSINTVDNKKQTPLYWACFNGSLQIVRHLVENGANVDKKSMEKAKNNSTIKTYILNAKNFDGQKTKSDKINFVINKIKKLIKDNQDTNNNGEKCSQEIIDLVRLVLHRSIFKNNKADKTKKTIFFSLWQQAKTNEKDAQKIKKALCDTFDVDLNNFANKTYQNFLLQSIKKVKKIKLKVENKQSFMFKMPKRRFTLW